MAVGVCGKESPAEVHGHGLLQNRYAFAPLIGAERFDLFIGPKRHRQLSRVASPERCGLNAAASPEPEPEVRRKFEHDEVRRGLERPAIKQTSVKSGARFGRIAIK